MNNISDDSKAILLLCSRLGLPPENSQASEPSGLSPLKPTEWHEIAERLRRHNLKPSDLFRLTLEDLQKYLEADENKAQRLASLLERGFNLANALDNLAKSSIHPLTRADTAYPEKYKKHLRGSSPPVLFYAGDNNLLGQKGIAIVGSRHADQIAQYAAEHIGHLCGLSELVLYSGGAKGVDTISMKAALNNRGYAVGILAESLRKTALIYKKELQSGNLCLATTYHPDTPFSVGTAMGRNKLIYTLADFAIVVASDKGKGGTWFGAVEALKYKWIPVFILTYEGMPKGNQALIEEGGLPLPYEDLKKIDAQKAKALWNFLEERAEQSKTDKAKKEKSHKFHGAEQLGLPFDSASQNSSSTPQEGSDSVPAPGMEEDKN